jgi:pimeloyl-ACP methyl ester carboxylesterase
MRHLLALAAVLVLAGCGAPRALPPAASGTQPLDAPAGTARPILAGPAQFTLPGAEPIIVFTYKPSNYAGGPLLVVFHGVGRNAADYRDHAIGMAQRFGAVVAAPLFDAARFQGERYQRGGVLRGGEPQPQDQWTYSFVPRIVAQVRAMEGHPDLPYYCIGHSAGGQFAMRMAGFLPGAARRIVAVNPGSDLFPTRDLRFRYGFGGLPPALGGDDALRAYLAAPLTLYLGTSDTVQDKNLDRSPEAMKQGSSRIERGRACFELARKLAAEKNWAFNWRKVEISGVGHSSTRMFAGREVEDALFGN